ncbi:MAG: methyltransferase domain-containing protein [Cytophagaceae bacterium]
MPDNCEYKKVEIPCPLCSSEAFSILGTRGNREYFGADPKAEPHVWTNVVQCKKCGFIYTNPQIYGLEFLEKEYYDDPQRYQAVNLSGITEMFEQRLSFISGFKRGGKLLDIGAGKGEFLNKAKDQKWDVFGVEPSGKFCLYAKQVYSINIVKGFLGEESFQKSSFDLITLNHVLEHVDEPEKLLRLIKSFLKPDGIIYVEVPNTGTLMLKLADIYFRLKGLKWSSRLSPLHPPFHKYGYTKSSMAYVLHKSGFEILEFKTFSGKDRGYKYQKRSNVTKLKEFVSDFLDLLGNRELLGVIATGKEL